MKFKKPLSGMLAFVMLVTSMLSTTFTVKSEEVDPKEEAVDTGSDVLAITDNSSEFTSNDDTLISVDYGLCDNVADGVILHAFCWSFQTIKENMADIAAAGYTAVQTSPANECNSDANKNLILMGSDESGENGDNGAWWWHYQPTDWTVGNYQLGTAADYKEMCDEADKYGVKIITDVLPNHTTPETDKVSKNFIDAVGGYEYLYHANGFTPMQGDDYSIRLNCTSYEMGGLPDVNTENPKFQAYFLQYCNKLIELGCDGFRFDTAKHIAVTTDPLDPATEENDWENNFWPVATGKETVTVDNVEYSLLNADKLFIYGEILQDSSIPYEEYAKYMGMPASDYGGILRTAIGNRDFSVSTISNWSHTISADKLVTWVESHDTYCNDHDSAWMSDWQIRMCWAAITARSGGTPLFFNRPDGSDGPNNNYWGNNVIGAKGNDQFKDPEVVAVNKFRNAMVGEGESLRNIDNDSSVLQIDRGTKGTCIINLGEERDISTPTTMADGTYTDTVSDRMFTVENGILTGHLDAGKIATIYDDTVSVSASASTSSFITETLDVTLSLKNALNGIGTYTTSEGDNGTFTDGQKITIGEKTNADGTVADITVALTASDADGKEITRTFRFTKRDPNYKITLYFDNSNYNWSKVYAYVYDDSTGSTVENAAWPGAAMTYDTETEYYKYELPDELVNGKVIFTNGTGTQFPGSGSQGLLINNTTSLFSNGTFIAFDSTAAQVLATPGSQSFTTDTLTLTLSVTNADYGTYTTTEGESGQFSNGDTIEIGLSSGFSDSITVTLSAVGNNGKTVTKKYTYTKSDPDSVTYIYFDNSAYNWSAVYVYVYDESGKEILQNAAWPGEEMTYDSVTGYYKYQVPNNLKNGLAIFTEKYSATTNRYPADGEQGIELNGSSILFGANHTWELYTPPTDTDTSSDIFSDTDAASDTDSDTDATSDTDSSTDSDNNSDTDTTTDTDVSTDISSDNPRLYFDNTYYNWGSVYAYVYDDSGDSLVKNAEWPGIQMTVDHETGYYVYDVPTSLTNGLVIFSKGNGNGVGYQYPTGKGLGINNTSMVLDTGENWNIYIPRQQDLSISDNDNYIYFYNNQCWYNVNVTLQGENTENGIMTWSDDLKCYYYKYDSSKNYETVTFGGSFSINTNDNGSVKIVTVNTETQESEIQPGKVFAVTGCTGSIDNYEPTSDYKLVGEWLPLSDLKSKTIYFSTGSVNGWSEARIYLWYGFDNGLTITNNIWPGDKMTYNPASKTYSYTYYYYGECDYNSVIFSYGTSQTVDLTLSPNDNVLYTLISGTTNKTYTCSLSSPVYCGNNIPVEFKYYDRLVSNGEASDVKEVTAGTVNVSLNDSIDNVVQTALTEFAAENTIDNLLDTYTFWASQQEYVLGIASMSRTEFDSNYAATINPAYFAYKTSAYSGKNASYFTQQLTSTMNEDNWITYYDSNGQKLSFEQLKPDLSNVARIEVCGFSMPKQYTLTMHYPTESTTALIPFKDDELYIAETTEISNYQSYYNQLFDEFNGEDAITPEGYVFDGWYQIITDDDGKVNSYVKVSSEKRYSYRITSNLELFAVYRAINSEEPLPGATVFANAVDSFYENDVSKIRYNTQFNIFNCQENDENITDVGVLYIKLPQEIDYNSIDMNTLKSEIIEFIGNEDTTTSSIAVYLVEDTPTEATTYCYKYNIENGEAVLTNKNRVQFVLTLKNASVTDGGDFSNLLAFGFFMRDGEWIVSDNCVAYTDGTANLVFVTD